jgi:DNA-binding transcriptional MerR regulator
MPRRCIRHRHRGGELPQFAHICAPIACCTEILHPLSTTGARGLCHAAVHRCARGTALDWRALAADGRPYRDHWRVNILAAPPRTRGGRRGYGQSHRRALSFIRRVRDLGFGLDEIRPLLDLDRSGRASCEKVREVASLHLGNVRAKLADLARRRRCYRRQLAVLGQRLPSVSYA